MAAPLFLAAAGNRAGTIAGIPGSPATKAFNVLNSLGAIAFSFSVSQILLEITDTLRQPPSGIVQGKRMVSISLTAAFSFYLVVAVTGYAALGNDVQGLILASFDTPSWAIILANAAVVLHMVFAFQVLAQPVFDTIESHIKYALLKRADAKFQKQQRRAAVGNGDAAPAHNPLDAPSPFDAEDGTKLGRTSTGNRSAMSMLGLAKTSLPPIEERMSASFSQTMQATMSQRMSGFDKSHHGGAKDEHHHDHKHVGIDSPDFPLVTRASHPPPMRMFSVGTGLANEEVPLNSENVLAPLWIRLLVRTAYVALVTLVSYIALRLAVGMHFACIACMHEPRCVYRVHRAIIVFFFGMQIAIVVPFFAAVVGVVGSLTFWPLVIYFPLKLYRKVYYVSPRFSMLLHVIWWGMLLVSTAAFIGSIYSVITSWSGFKVS